MLRRLHIENFILIEELCLEFEEGATAFTGETGAGKSMILDAVAAAIGGRVSPEVVRHGSKRALVEAEFLVPAELKRILDPLLEEAEIEREDKDVLTLMREINERGGKCRIDGQPLSLNAFRQIGALFVDILGQHEHQHLTKASNHLVLLDAFGGLSSDAKMFKTFYDEVKNLEAQLEELQAGKSAREKERELSRFQLRELEDAALLPGEEESLREERVLLAHAEELALRTLNGYALLEGNEGNERPGASDILARAAKEIEGLVRYDASIEALSLQLTELSESAKMIARELRERSERSELDPERLEAIEERLDQLNTLKRKYNVEVPFLIEKRDALSRLLEEGEQEDQRFASLEGEIERKREHLVELALTLSDRRRTASLALQARIEGELAELGMAGTKFLARMDSRVMGPLGGDEIEFLIAPNLGEPPKPLAKIASGGELARLMLAFKTVLAGNDPTPTLIFDEVDAGISGKAALVVAEKIFRLSRRSQIILVTHLPSIAAAAHHHFLLHKETVEGKTRVQARWLDGEGRIEALSRLIGGESTPASRLHAGELLARAKNYSSDAVPEGNP